MDELHPPCAGAIEEKNIDGSFRVRDEKYIDQLFTGVNVEVGQFITITHVVTDPDLPWLVRHYTLDLNRPMPRMM